MGRETGWLNVSQVSLSCRSVSGSSLRRSCCQLSSNLDRLRNAHGSTPTAELRLEMQRIMHSALARTESRGAHVREDFPARDDRNWLKHSLAWVDDRGQVRLDYRPVHLATLSGDVEPIAPIARTY